MPIDIELYYGIYVCESELIEKLSQHHKISIKDVNIEIHSNVILQTCGYTDIELISGNDDNKDDICFLIVPSFTRKLNDKYNTFISIKYLDEKMFFEPLPTKANHMKIILLNAAQKLGAEFYSKPGWMLRYGMRLF